MPDVGDGVGGGVVDECAAMRRVIQTKRSVPTPSITAAFHNSSTKKPRRSKISLSEINGDASGTRFRVEMSSRFLGSRMKSWLPPSRPAKAWEAGSARSPMV